MKSGFQLARVVVFLWCLVVFAAPVWSETLFVDDNGPAQFKMIQAAVDAARDGDLVVVNPGLYVGPGNSDIDLGGKAIRIRGTDPLDPDVVEATVIDCKGTAGAPHRGFYVVGCDGAEISGLTVMNGLASAGGGLYCRDSMLVVTYCKIVNNATLSGDEKGDLNGGPGGGFYCEDSVVDVVACLISGNAAGDGAESGDRQGGTGGDGGGVYAVNSTFTVIAAVITGNTAGRGGDSVSGVAGNGGRGGGLCADVVTVMDSTISGNSAGDGGRGAQNGHGGHGGGLHADAAAIERSIVEGNTAGAGGQTDVGLKTTAGRGGDGGGLYCNSLEITNSLVVGNQGGKGGAADLPGAAVQGNGGGIRCFAGLVGHCTIADNLVHPINADAKGVTGPSVGVGAGVFCSPETILTHSILWGNTPDQLAGHQCDSIFYGDIEDGSCLGVHGTISADPLFVRHGSWVDASDPSRVIEPDDPKAVWASGDYHPQGDSPCANAGDPDYTPGVNETDLDGNPRRIEGAVDIGAYELRNIVPVYRFWSGQMGRHFYTTDVAVKDMYVSQLSDIWAFEGIVYYAHARQSESGLLPVFRFWSDKLSSHFWTISKAEKEKLINQFSAVWTLEGVSFYAYPEGQQPAGAKPIHRFWSDRLGTHFYTIHEDEKNKLLDQYAHVWTYEGIVWYAYEQPGGEEPGPGPVPADPVAYTFTGGSEGALFVLELTSYVDGEQAKVDSPAVALVPRLGRMEMVVDFGTMRTALDELYLESEFVEHASSVTGGELGRAEIPFALSVQGAFGARTVRGPYDIDTRELAFPAGGGRKLPGEDEIFMVTGSAVIDGRKYDIDLGVGATDFDIDGRGMFDISMLPDRLDARMAGPFSWSREGREDLLLETTVKGRTLRLYMTSIRLMTMGLWQGKAASPAQK